MFVYTAVVSLLDRTLGAFKQQLDKQEHILKNKNKKQHHIQNTAVLQNGAMCAAALAELLMSIIVLHWPWENLKRRH